MKYIVREGFRVVVKIYNLVRLHVCPRVLSSYNKNRGALYNQLAKGEKRVLGFELCYNTSISPFSVS